MKKRIEFAHGLLKAELWSGTTDPGMVCVEYTFYSIYTQEEWAWWGDAPPAKDDIEILLNDMLKYQGFGGLALCGPLFGIEPTEMVQSILDFNNNKQQEPPRKDRGWAVY